MSDCKITIGGGDNYVVDEFDTTPSDRSLCMENNHSNGIIRVKVGDKFHVTDSNDVELFSVDNSGDMRVSNILVGENNEDIEIYANMSGVSGITSYGNNDFLFDNQNGPWMFKVRDSHYWQIQDNSSVEIFKVYSTGNIVNRLGTDTSATTFEIRGNDNTSIFKVAGDHQVTSVGNIKASSGVDIDADDKAFTIGASGDISIIHSSSNSRLTNSTGDFTIENIVNNKRIILKLGTNTSATKFEIQNSSGSTLFSTDGSGITSISTGTNDTTSVIKTLCIGHTVTGTPGVGIGVSMGFKVEDLSLNAVYSTILESIATDVGATTSAFDFIIKNRSGNNTDPTEAIRIKANGDLQMVGHINLPTNGKLNFGDLPHCYIRHNGSGSLHLVNSTGDIVFDNTSSTKNIYFRLGSDTSATMFEVRGDDNEFRFRVSPDDRVQISGPQINKKQSAQSLATVNTNSNITYDEILTLGGLILRDCNGASRTDTIATGSSVISGLLNAIVGMTFELLICNISGTGEDLTLSNNGSSTIVGINVIKAGSNTNFTGIVKDIGSGTEEYTLYSHGTDTSGGGTGTTIPTNTSTIALPTHKDELNLEDEKPVYCYLQTNAGGLKFNKGRIYITQSGQTTTFTLAVYKLTSGSEFGDLTTYDNSTKIVESNGVTWTSNSGDASNGIGFVVFTFTETTLNSTDIYFVGLYNTGQGPKYLGYRDAGDPNRGLSGLFYTNNDSFPSGPGSSMGNTYNSNKGDPPYVNLYYS